MPLRTDAGETTMGSGVVMSLAGKVALITGGSRGIGAATVRLFSQAGAKVAFSFQSAEARAETLAAECGGPAHCRPIKQELATPEDGRLIVNHGICPSHEQPISTMTTEQWRKTLGINLDSSFGLVQAAAAQMQSRK